MSNNCPYKKCGGGGLIPFVNREGKVIPHAFTHCDCHPIYGLETEAEHWHDIQPDDYDFPMSETFRAWTYEHCGVPDPASTTDETQQDETGEHDSPPKIVEVIHRVSSMGRKEFALLQEHDRTLKYLMGKAKEREAQNYEPF